MKKFLALIMALSLSLLLFGCNPENGNVDDEEEADNTTADDNGTDNIGTTSKSAETGGVTDTDTNVPGDANGTVTTD